MLKVVGQDIISGSMGFVGTEPGKLYRMGSLNGVAEASGNPLTLKRCKNKPLRGLTIYGKSSQDGTPSPENPVEIKSVVNPTVKVYGKNLWDNFKILSLGNVKQENGTYIATTGAMQVDITPDFVGARPLLLKANNAYTFSLKTTVSISRPRFICLKYTNGEIDNFIFANQNFVNFVPKRDVEKVGFILYDSVAGDKAYDAQLEMGSEATPYEPYHEQNVILPYTLNAVSVPSGGNYTDENGQQWIADYVDMAKGKLIRLVDSAKMDNTQSIVGKTEWLLAVPAEIDLTPEEITALKSLHTYAGVTNVSNDAGAWMKVVYDT